MTATECIGLGFFLIGSCAGYIAAVCIHIDDLTAGRKMNRRG